MIIMYYEYMTTQYFVRFFFIHLKPRVESFWGVLSCYLTPSILLNFRCIRLDGPAARCSGRPKLPRQFVPVRNFEPRLFVPMPGNMGRPAFTFINLYIFCNLQRIINKKLPFVPVRNLDLGYLFRCQAIWADLLLHL